eukprot:Pgem_evm2s4340
MAIPPTIFSMPTSSVDICKIPRFNCAKCTSTGRECLQCNPGFKKYLTICVSQGVLLKSCMVDISGKWRSKSCMLLINKVNVLPTTKSTIYSFENECTKQKDTITIGNTCKHINPTTPGKIIQIQNESNITGYNGEIWERYDTISIPKEPKTNNNNDDSAKKTILIAGIAVGTWALIMIVSLIGFLLYRNKKKDKNKINKHLGIGVNSTSFSTNKYQEYASTYQ